MLSAMLVLSLFSITLGLMLNVIVDNNYYCSINRLHQINFVIFIRFMSGVCLGECIIILISVYYEKCQKNNTVQEF